MTADKNIFCRKDYALFATAIFFLTAGFTCMAFDPVDNGFGVLTLWIAPPLLLIGFALPVAGIIGVQNLPEQFSFRTFRDSKWKHLFGIAVLLIAFIAYCLTLEPTASLWDCAEFIAASFKLQVPHTPGTPLSLLLGRSFSMISLGDVTRVAWSINLMSALFSALCVLLVYHIIYFFTGRLVSGGLKNAVAISILASACGSLSLAFSDTFWFSAVEAETYGPACFFLVLILWLVLTGKDLTERLRSRRLILIMYLAGLGYCVHPMCLLAIPVLPFLWYTSKRKLTPANVLISVFAGLLIVLLINRFVAVGLFEIAFGFDRFFVNTLHFPFYTGAIVFVLIFIIVGIFLLKRYSKYAVYIWSVVFLVLGFTPYLMLFIRSNFNPPIDESNPEDLAMIKAYMNREGYPSSPLLYGPYFDASLEDITVAKKAYFKTETSYAVSGNIPEYQYENSRQTILPRMYSRDEDHIETYRNWAGLGPNKKPKFSHNLKFMLGYQLGHMYFRYLLFNFAGRESDEQHSSWLKPWNKIPDRDSAFYNKARNQYWMIPLLMGIFGMMYQFKKDRKGFLTVTVFFLITGIILVLYLNSPPNEPRERDYIYVGSFIAFCFWIGTGITALSNFLKVKGSLILVGTMSLIIPGWMLYQNYDDHDRSGRTFQVDHAKNILRSCAPDAILFTGGDNDTFPLWYVQEVEGFRTDVRVMVLSYFNTDWYINQLRKPYYNSRSFKLTLSQDDYRQYGANDVLYVQESIREGIDAKKYLHLLKQGHEALKVQTTTGDFYNVLPSRLLKIKVDKKDLVMGNSDSLAHSTGRELIFKVTDNYLHKNALAVLDLIVSNGWERPVYFNFTSLNTFGIRLQPHVVQEGQIFRLSTIENYSDTIVIDKEKTFHNLIATADYNNLSKDHVYFNYEDYHLRMISPLRQSFNALAEAYLLDNNQTMAGNVLQTSLEKLHAKHLKPSFSDLQTAAMLQFIGEDSLAASLVASLFEYQHGKITVALNSGSQSDRTDIYVLQESARMLQRLGITTHLEKLKNLNAELKLARR